MKEYKMQPIKRPEGAPVTKLPTPIPTLGPAAVRKHARILAFKDDEKIAVICENMRVLNAGELTVRDVDVSSLGVGSVAVGDILAFNSHDVKFEHPMISHRHHQQHQHPKDLVAIDEL